jgi:3-isopropylmalate dehydratase small subunit
MIIKGYTHVYGDNIDTDRIIPGKYTKTLNVQSLADHVLEDLDPDFRTRMQPGDIIVAGDNFGCGSSREQAPVALKVSGVSLVIARYFARIFFRNAINIGLPLVEVPDHRIELGDVIEVDLQSGKIFNVTKSDVYEAIPLPAVMVDILKNGGLVPYMKRYGNYKLDNV